MTMARRWSFGTGWYDSIVLTPSLHQTKAPTVHELIPLAGIALFGAVLFFLRPPTPGGAAARSHMLKGGVLVCGADFLVEFMGTHTGGWTYNKSLLFITGTIPIELVILFFSCGVWLAAIHLIIRGSAKSPPLQPLLLSLMGLGGIVYGVIRADGGSVNMIVFTLPFGLWGFSRFESPRVASGAVLLAALTAVADWFVETWAVEAGNYGYASGFHLETPLTYAMLVLGFLGILEGRSKPTIPEAPRT